MTTPVLRYGADYNPDQWLDRPDILAKDIELMKKANVNVVSPLGSVTVPISR